MGLQDIVWYLSAAGKEKSARRRPGLVADGGFHAIVASGAHTALKRL
jgi:hypothetical protein